MQEYLPGEAFGCSVLAKDGAVYRTICHHRLREYPVSGGPFELLREHFAAGFMCVRRNNCVGNRLFRPCDVRIQMRSRTARPGSWKLTPASGVRSRSRARPGRISPYSWFCLAANLPLPEEQPAAPVRMVYYPADFAAALGYLRSGKPGQLFRRAA